MTQELKKLTKRQAMVLDVITGHIQEVGYPPTIREIGDEMGIRSTNGVNDHLKALERKGYVERESAKSRALRPLFGPDGTPFDPSESPGPRATSNKAAVGSSTRPESIPASLRHSRSDDQELADVIKIPIVGRIAAGLPMAAIENTEEVVNIGEGLLGRSKDVFGLRVTGDSMIDDGIFSGDYIFVKKQQDVRDGEIVAAMVDGEATVKRIFREGERVRLQPANDAMEPIFVHQSEARDTCILGKVVGVFRRI